VSTVDSVAAQITEITDAAALEHVLAQSAQAPVFIFKHSNRCAISARAANRVAEYLAKNPPGMPPVYLIDVIASRPLSNAVAEATGVTHASPQMLLIRDRKAVWNASHGAITGDALTAALNAVP
jgi:bacillithiol system protein YtxJ